MESVGRILQIVTSQINNICTFVYEYAKRYKIHIHIVKCIYCIYVFTMFIYPMCIYIIQFMCMIIMSLPHRRGLEKEMGVEKEI